MITNLLFENCWHGAGTYDELGRILRREQTGSGSEFTHSTSYAYDALGQLLTCKEGTVTEAYGYDVLGNRLFKDVDGIRKETYQYNGLNQMVGRTDWHESECLSYQRDQLCDGLSEPCES